MKLGIYSIQQVLFEGEVERITLATTSGEITVLDNHMPLVSRVVAGGVRYRREGKEGGLSLPAGGVLEVRPGNEAIILVH